MRFYCNRTGFGTSWTASIHGDRDSIGVNASRYNVTVDLTAPDFAPTCSCPYAGPGVCKHVVAVLLALTDELPVDVKKQSDALVEEIPHDQLRDFVGFATVAEEELSERDGVDLDEEKGEIHPSNADYGHLDPNTRNVIHKGTIRRIMPRNTKRYSETGQVVYLGDGLNWEPDKWGNLAERIVGRLRKTTVAITMMSTTTVMELISTIDKDTVQSVLSTRMHTVLEPPRGQQ